MPLLPSVFQLFALVYPHLLHARRHQEAFVKAFQGTHRARYTVKCSVPGLIDTPGLRGQFTPPFPLHLHRWLVAPDSHTIPPAHVLPPPIRLGQPPVARKTRAATMWKKDSFELSRRRWRRFIARRGKSRFARSGRKQLATLREGRRGGSTRLGEIVGAWAMYSSCSLCSIIQTSVATFYLRLGRSLSKHHGA